MLISEKEARTKWCPMVKLQDGEAGYTNSNRFVSDGKVYFSPGANCIASDCMMWLPLCKLSYDGVGGCGLLNR